MSAPEFTIDETVALLRDHAFRIAAETYGEPPDMVIHCRLAGIGADWTLDGAIELAERSSWRGWVESTLGHNLGVVALTDGRERLYCFDVWLPKTVAA